MQPSTFNKGRKTEQPTKQQLKTLSNPSLPCLDMCQYIVVTYVKLIVVRNTANIARLVTVKVGSSTMDLTGWQTSNYDTVTCISCKALCISESTEL